MSILLKLSVPILATLISSTVDSPKFECLSAATALHPCIEQFRSMSVELFGDTGAAYDIGPLQALQQQGIDPEVFQPWISCLQNPVRFATGGGPQTSHDEHCPLAMSIWQQIKRGQTFIWRHGEAPYIVLDHKKLKCTVWCPLGHRWYAKRVRNNVPIFAIEPQQLKDQPAVATLTNTGDNMLAYVILVM